MQQLVSGAVGQCYRIVDAFVLDFEAVSTNSLNDLAGGEGYFGDSFDLQVHNSFRAVESPERA